MKLNNFNIRLEALRLDNDKKQGDIANVLGVKRNTYSKWENLINDIPIEKVNELANFYNTSIDYILGLSNNHIKIEENLSVNWNLFSNRLLLLRKNNKLNQKDLSEKLGFPQTTYSQYERGVRKPTTLKLLLIANFFKVSFDYLVGRIDNYNLK